MTLNRATIVFATFFILRLFYRNFFSEFVAVICSTMVICFPGILWNMAHHHYQMTLLIFGILLNVCYSRKLQSCSRYLMFTLTLLAFYLSVSIQLVIASIPFLVVIELIRNKFRLTPMMYVCCISILSFFLFVLPDLSNFIQLISLSNRLDWTPYSGMLPSTRAQLLSLLVPAGEWMYFELNGHFTVGTYFSFTVLSVTMLSIFSFRLTEKWDQHKFLIFILLGILPTIAAFLLQFNFIKVPIVHSMDVTRVWWFSIIFIFFGVGNLLERLSQSDSSLTFYRFFIPYNCIALIFVIAGPTLFPEFERVSNFHWLVVIVPTLFVLLPVCLD